uniref:Uncharacterized protein n=1 Tax=viral metagenome TaxID=1070528 RepID=A0A6M3JTK4_9ZZZZ
MDYFTYMDGVQIPLPRDVEEWKAFNAWLKANGDKDPYNPEQHYDLLSAFRAKLNRKNGGHLPDTYKLPGHPTFSVESIYYKKGMKAGRWEGENYIPIIPTSQDQIDLMNKELK